MRRRPKTKKIGSPIRTTNRSPNNTTIVAPVRWPPEDVDELEEDVSELEREAVIDEIVLEIVLEIELAIEVDNELTELVMDPMALTAVFTVSVTEAKRERSLDWTDWTRNPSTALLKRSSCLCATDAKVTASETSRARIVVREAASEVTKLSATEITRCSRFWTCVSSPSMYWYESVSDLKSWSERETRSENENVSAVPLV